MGKITIYFASDWCLEFRDTKYAIDHEKQIVTIYSEKVYIIPFTSIKYIVVETESKKNVDDNGMG